MKNILNKIREFFCNEPTIPPPPPVDLTPNPFPKVKPEDCCVLHRHLQPYIDKIAALEADNAALWGAIDELKGKKEDQE